MASQGLFGSGASAAVGAGVAVPGSYETKERREVLHAAEDDNNKDVLDALSLATLNDYWGDVAERDFLQAPPLNNGTIDDVNEDIAKREYCRLACQIVRYIKEILPSVIERGEFSLYQKAFLKKDRVLWQLIVGIIGFTYCENYQILEHFLRSDNKAILLERLKSLAVPFSMQEPAWVKVLQNEALNFSDGIPFRAVLLRLFNDKRILPWKYFDQVALQMVDAELEFANDILQFIQIAGTRFPSELSFYLIKHFKFFGGEWLNKACQKSDLLVQFYTKGREFFGVDDEEHPGFYRELALVLKHIPYEVIAGWEVEAVRTVIEYAKNKLHKLPDGVKYVIQHKADMKNTETFVTFSIQEIEEVAIKSKDNTDAPRVMIPLFESMDMKLPKLSVQSLQVASPASVGLGAGAGPGPA